MDRCIVCDAWGAHYGLPCPNLNNRTLSAKDLDAAHIKQLEEKIANFPAELEAQHRKTWALAMEINARKVNNTFNGVVTGLETIIAETPCPPIEATKDK